MYNFLEVSKELAKKFKQNIKIDKKELQGNGTFRVVATSNALDRDGEIITVEGWDFENFKKNPVVLWGHRYDSLPIGAVTNIEVDTINQQIIMDGVFADTPQAQEIRRLYDDGFLKTVSVGFIGSERDGNVITKKEMLELSFVGIPSNPDALSLEKILKVAKTFEKSQDLEEENDSPNQEEAILHNFAALIKDMQALFLNFKLKFAPEQKSEEKYMLSYQHRIAAQDCINMLQTLIAATENADETKETAKSLLLDVQGMQKALEKVIKKAKTVDKSL